MLHATHGHLASKNENKWQKNIGRWFEVMTVGTTDKVALYWYAEPFVLIHRSWCGDYTHTRTHAHELHACNTHTNTCSHACTQHSDVRTQPRTHATLTHTHARMHAHTTRPTHTLTLKCSSYTCMRRHQALTDTYTTRWFPCMCWSLVAPA